MPELPQIEPQGVDLSKPIVQSQPSHIGTDVAAQLDKVEDQAVEMGKQAQRMNRYINFHMADAEYISKSANIFDATDRIIDPDTQFATRQRVLGQLKDEIAAKYPDAGPELGPQLDVRASEDVRRAKLQAHTLSVQNATDNLDALEEPSIVAATNAPTQADADTQIKGFHDSVIAARDLGMISIGDANKRIAKYDYNLNYAQITALGMSSQQGAMKVLAMKPGDPGVNIRPQDLGLIQYRISGILQRQDNSAHREFEGVINQNDDNIFNRRPGFTDPNTINELHRNGMASTEATRYGTGAEPTNPAVANPLLHYIDTAPDMTPNEWRHWEAENVARNKFLEPSDREAMHSGIAARISDGEIKEGQLKKTYLAEIKRALRYKYPGSMGTNSNPRAMANYAEDEEKAIAQLDGAKTFKELDEIHKSIMKNLPSGPVRHPLSDADKAKKLMDALGIK